MPGAAKLTCPVADVSVIGRGVRQVMLDLPEPVPFRAGQYLELVLPRGTKHPFSIASAPELEGQLEIHVRATPGSDDSLVIEDFIDAGTAWDIEVPKGDCFVTEAPPRPLLLIAAGTGITQMKSIFEHLAAKVALPHPVDLYWGNLVADDIYMEDRLRGWEAKHENFRYVPVISEPGKSPGWTGRTGLVPHAVLEDHPQLDNFHAVVSGGPNMVYATLDLFVEHGFVEDRMQSDIFSYAPRK